MKCNSYRYKKMLERERLFTEAGLLDEYNMPTCEVFSALGENQAQILFDGYCANTGMDSSILLAHTLLEQFVQDENCNALAVLTCSMYEHCGMDDPHFLADFMADAPHLDDNLLMFCRALSVSVRELLYGREDNADEDDSFLFSDYD